ncbi:hypothetical protein AMK18_00130 [Streptomyces sp. CB01249]|nr:hypothetical protein AMK18_00130 [Streptomyces sp. CB01249]
MPGITELAVLTALGQARRQQLVQRLTPHGLVADTGPQEPAGRRGRPGRHTYAADAAPDARAIRTCLLVLPDPDRSETDAS